MKKNKWLVWWRDGTVTVWDAGQWTAAQIAATANHVTAALCTEELANEVVAWWGEYAWPGFPMEAAARCAAEAVEAS